VQDAANQPRGMMRNLSPEQREKVAKMTPEERKAFFQKLRAERGANGGNAGPGQGPRGTDARGDQPREAQGSPSRPDPRPTPSRMPSLRLRTRPGPRPAPSVVKAARPHGKSRGPGDRPQLTPEQRAKLEALSPEERRAFFQKLRAEREANGRPVRQPAARVAEHSQSLRPS
jgi:multidrug efflux system membrane fusion protein